MRAMRLHSVGESLAADQVPIPRIGDGQLLLKVSACAVCRTDLHVVDGELSEPKLPLVPGHEIVGRVEEVGAGVENFRAGDRVGIPWLGWTCGECDYCVSGPEDLCTPARFTGHTIDGGQPGFHVGDPRLGLAVPPGL